MPDRRRNALRAAVLVPAGAFAVHQLRFALAFGGSSHTRLASAAHSYLTALAPALVVMLAVALAAFGLRLARGRERATSASGRRLWLVLSGVLLASFWAQETVEGLAASGHLPSPAALLAAGGWIALPLSTLVGLALTLALGGAAVAQELVASTSPLRPPIAAPYTALPAPLPAIRLGRCRRAARARAPPRIAIAA